MISLHIYDTPDRGLMLADLSVAVRPENGGSGFRLGTNKHGFSLLDVPRVERRLLDAFINYDWPGTPHIEASDEFGQVAWEGRLEDIGLVPGGVQLGGLGYWRAGRDAPYTALWSDVKLDGWAELYHVDLTAVTPAKYVLSKQDRLYISLRKGEEYSNNSDRGGWAYKRPHNSNRSDQMVLEFDYSVTLPTNWIVRIRSFDEDFAGSTVENTVVTGDDSNQAGSHSETITAGKEYVAIEIFNNTGSDAENTDESDDWFAEFTALRVKSAASTVLASDIAADLVAFINGINSSQLQAGSSLIEATSQDIQQAVYEDLYPADILDALALRHGFDAAVWEDRLLNFAPVGTNAKDWFVDVTRITMQRSLEHVANSSYAVYRDANGRTLRTSPATDQASVDRHGLVRRVALPVTTNDGSEAKAYSDQFLTDRQDFQIRAQVEFLRLEDAAGAAYPLYALRAGDTLTLRNIEAGAPADVDHIRNFRVGESEYGTDKRLAVSHREGVPTLVNLVSQAQGRAQDDWTGDIFDPRQF